MKVYIADTHTSEYLIHKYWARKPHNVVCQFIKKYSAGDWILDPFCGSCVTNIEAAKLGIKSIGVDINPIATLIGEVSTTKISINKLTELYLILTNDFAKTLAAFYTTNSGLIRYCVHELIIKCPSCSRVFKLSEAKKKGKAYICPDCSNTTNANLGTIHSSSVMRIVTTNEDISDNALLLIEETKKANKDYSKDLNTDPLIYDNKFIENKRILSYENTSLRKFYTARTFTVLSYMADKIHEIDDKKIRNALLICLTSTATQCSRLIPFRNELSTGGPAWSVPGFWIPAIHLELNPLQSFESRFKKIVKGLSKLNLELNNVSETVFYDCGIHKSIPHIKSKKISYIFADPPYGDSIPYLEFSAIWNAWLKKIPDYNQEIVVSDGSSRNKRWDRYKTEMIEAVSEIVSVLKKDGHITFTFNQLSLDAWHTLLLAAERASLDFENVALTLPAVIPAKARFSVKGSYVGDFYITFKKALKPNRVFISEEELYQKLDNIFNQLAAIRNGLLSFPQIIRVSIGLILKKQYMADTVKIAEKYLVDKFQQKNGLYIYKNHTVDVNNDKEIISKKLVKMLSAILKNADKLEWEVVKEVLEKFEFEDAPEISEIIDVLSSICRKKSGRYSLKEQYQPSLFK